MNAGDLLMGLAGTGALLLPGWLVAHSLRVPQPWLAGFCGGAVTLLLLILGLELVHIPLRLATVAGAWSVLTLFAWGWHRRLRRRPGPPAVRTEFGWRENWPLLACVVPLLGVVAYRALAQPLFGIDTIFRWDFLARQMLTHGSLAFYPPVTAADYAIYAWPDGIAPAVSAMYFWLYAIAGGPRPLLTAPLILGQFVLLTLAVHTLAGRLSARAGAFAVALLACSPLVGWATAMGQETGLTSLALAGLLLYLPRTRDAETTPAILAAAFAATLGALAREYGLALPALGLALCAGRRLSRRATLLFAFATAATALPWYARNWVRTGNPVFDLSLGGIFPANEVHAWLNTCYQGAFGWSHLPDGATGILLANTAAGLLALLAGACLLHRTERALLAGAGLLVLIWAASLGYTAAGFTYSLRVLSPALALGAVLGGVVLARVIPGRRLLAGAAAGLALFAADSALRTLTLPMNVHRLPVALWLGIGRSVQDYHERPIYAEIARLAGRERLLVLGPTALLTQHGAGTVPLWSPAVRFLFDAKLRPAEIARRLRAEGIGFVLLNTGAVNECFLSRSAYFREPDGTLAPVWSDGDMVLQRIVAPLAP